MQLLCTSRGFPRASNPGIQRPASPRLVRQRGGREGGKVGAAAGCMVGRDRLVGGSRESQVGRFGLSIPVSLKQFILSLCLL